MIANDGEGLETWLARRDQVRAKNSNGNGFGTPLMIAAQMAGWQTPTVNDATGSAYSYAGGDHSKVCLKLPGEVALAGWATPTAAAKRRSEEHGSGREPHPHEGALAGWPTPMAGSPRTETRNEAGNTDASRKTAALVGTQVAGHGLTLPETPPGPARFTADGRMLTGSSAGMASGGRLNPAFSAWLMGFPSSWCAAALSSQLPRPSRKGLPVLGRKTRARGASGG